MLGPDTAHREARSRLRGSHLAKLGVHCTTKHLRLRRYGAALGGLAEAGPLTAFLSGVGVRLVRWPLSGKPAAPTARRRPRLRSRTGSAKPRGAGPRSRGRRRCTSRFGVTRNFPPARKVCVGWGRSVSPELRARLPTRCTLCGRGGASRSRHFFLGEPFGAVLRRVGRRFAGSGATGRGNPRGTASMLSACPGFN